MRRGEDEIVQKDGHDPWSLRNPEAKIKSDLPKHFVNREYKRSTIMQSLARSRTKPNPFATDFVVFEKQNETNVSPILDILQNLNPIRLKITNYRKYQRITRESPKRVRALPSMRFCHSRTSSSRRHRSKKKSLRDKRTKKKILPTLPPPFYDSACGLRVSLRDDMNASRTPNQ